MELTCFASPSDFRTWLKRHHATHTELLVGFYSKGSSLGGVTYAEALDEALCFGWIDGVRRNVDEVSYSIRFTPRKSSSIWSLINVKHVERLLAAKRMTAAGIKVFEARQAHKTGIYSFEKKSMHLNPHRKNCFAPTRRHGCSGKRSRRVTNVSQCIG